jgi:pimeloyl-ACP methyl ester carboxylesterase
MSKLNQQIVVSDGRKLGFNQYGPTNGSPMFYFHGSPSSRIEFTLFGNEDLLEKLNVCLIAADRPGSGLSDFQPNRKFLDWPMDVVALANHLELEKFSILGYSGGGPYSAVCAYSIPDRIIKAGIVSGTAPFTEPLLVDGINVNSRQFMDLSYQKPWLSRMILRSMGLMTRVAPMKVIANAMAALPEADRLIVANLEVQQGFLAMIQEALRHGPRGAQHDTRLMVTAWDFEPKDIQIPVYLWHGEEDQNAPIAMGHYMANAISKCEVKFFPGEGHLSLFKKNAETIIQTLL